MKLKLLLLFVLASFAATAQDSSAKPAFIWQVTSKKIADKKYELIFTTAGVAGTQLYAPSQDFGGLPSAELTFNDSSIATETFTSTGTTKKINSAIFEKELNVSEANAAWKAVIQFKDKVPAQLLGKLSVNYNKGEEFLQDIPFSFGTPLEGGVASGGKIKVSSIDITKPVSDCGDDGTKNKSLLSIFLLGLLGGIIALLTPCVFPLIPVTVTFFTKKSTNRRKAISNAVFYGLSIFFIYVAITIPFHIASKTISPEIFNNISTNVWLNLIFFAVFVFFALSFFGLFEIVLPSSFANNADSKSGLSNFSGIFFMAATLCIVSFSCTGPLLGTLLANVADQGPWPLTVGAAGFGVALGLPFALFAMFPNWLHSLPKSGGWMTDVKVVLGFVELALAVKFLANADNVEQWGILKREVFVAAWIIISVCIVLYLLGWLKMSHSSPVKKFSLARILFIVLFGSFAIYLAPGLTNTKYARLSLFSGFPPPLSYSVYSHHVLLSRGIMPIHNNYEKALAQAKAENKPLLIDFTGWACVNCRRMEEKVWTDGEVEDLMSNKFIVVSLYVDEKTKLPTTEQTTFKTGNGTEKSITTVGDKWATFQIENFKATSQPQYAIINANEIALTKTKFYTPDPKEFAEWLKCGLEAYGKK
jgi:cytochrome c biogenesis protein CcdA/thioredoxin-related protein